MPRIRRDAAFVHQANGDQHRAAVFVQKNSIAHGLADDLEAKAFGFEGRGMGTIVIALNGRRVHKVELDVTNAPLARQHSVGLAEVPLGSRVGGIQRVEWINVLVDIGDPDGPSLGIVHQPVLVVLVNPGTG